MKKITLGLLTPVVLATPLLTAISCGGDEGSLSLADSYEGKEHAIADSHIEVIPSSPAIADDPLTEENEASPAVVGSINLTKDIITLAESFDYLGKLLAAAKKYETDAKAIGDNEKKQIALAKSYMSTVINETFNYSSIYVSYAKELLANEKFTAALETSKILKYKDKVIVNVDSLPIMATNAGVTHNNLLSMLDNDELNIGVIIGEDHYHWNYQYRYKTMIVDKTETILTSQGLSSNEKAVMDRIGLTNDILVQQYVKMGVTSAKIFNLAELLGNQV